MSETMETPVDVTQEEAVKEEAVQEETIKKEEAAQDEPVQTESIEAPAQTENAEAPAQTENAEEPAQTENAETPVQDEAKPAEPENKIDPNLDALYRKVREKRHRGTGLAVYDVTYGARDSKGHPKYPGNGDGHGHRIYYVLKGEEYTLFEREPDPNNKAAATRDLDEQELQEALKSEELLKMERSVEHLRELARRAESLARRGDTAEEQESMEFLSKDFENTEKFGLPAEEELSARFEKAKKQYEEHREIRNRHREEKEALIREAEEYSKNLEFKNSDQVMKEQLEKWKRIGSAGTEADQTLWEAFNAHRQAFYERRKAHFDEMKAQRGEAREKKRLLIEEAKETVLQIDNFRDASAKMNDIFDRWKAAGSAGHAADEKLWQQFFAVRSEFREKRNAFYHDQNENRQEVTKKKEEILEKARKITESKDYSKENSELMKQFNTEWKEAGSAGHETDEKLWLEYRKVQDAFWEGKHEEHAAARKEYTDKLESAIERKKKQMEDLQNQVYHLKDKMHSVQNPGYLINMGSWVAEKEAKIKELKSQIDSMNRRL